jgi:hypothetical protein
MNDAIVTELKEAAAGCHLIWGLEIDRENKSATVIIDRAAVDAAVWDEDRPATKSFYLLKMTISPDGATDDVQVLRG